MSKLQRFGLGHVGFVDLSLNLLLGFASLFIILLLILRTEETASVTNMVSPGQILIKVTWQGEVDNDVDTWIRSENPASVISFQSKSSGVMFLDRDDLGTSSDIVVLENGEVSTNPLNQEIAYIKYNKSNRYTVNLHLYSVSTAVPTVVQVELIQTQPSYRVWYQVTVTLLQKGDQATAFVFYTNDDGSIKDVITDVQENVVYDQSKAEVP